VFGEVDGEDFCLFWRVVGVGGDGDLFVAMQVVCGIVECSLGSRFDETLARDKNDRTEDIIEGNFDAVDGAV